MKRELIWLSIIVFSFILAFYIFSIFIPHNIVITSGELIYSFDYKFHFLRELSIIDWSDINSYLVCKDCWAINHYSNYFSMMYMAINFIGELLGFNPFLYYLLVNFIPQLIASYIFLKVFFKKINPLVLIAVFIIFSTNGYKLSLISSGSWYGLTHSMLIVYYSILILILKNLSKLNYKKIILLSIIPAFILSTSLSFTVNYLPYTIYLSIFILLFYLKNIINNLSKFLLLVFILSLPSLFLFYPLWKSIILNIKNMEISVKNFNNPVNNETFFEALFFRQLSWTNSKLIKILTLSLLSIPSLFFLLSKKINIKSKLLLFGIVSFLVILLMGNKFLFNLYLILFKHLPLMDSMRSSHRLYLYILMIYMYLTGWFFTKVNNKFIKIKYLWLFSLIIIFLMSSVKVFSTRLAITIIPNSYFNVYNLLKDKPNKTLYLPAYLPLHQSIITSYEWAKFNTNVKSIYVNPFATYLPFEGLINYGQFYYPENKIEPIMSFSREEFDNFVDEQGINYLIVDRNFDWKLFPDFRLNSQKYEVIRKFSNIYLLRVK